MNKQLFRFTLFLLVYLSLPSIAAAQVEISAVSSVDNPAVGDTIEVAINIAGASNVAGYEIKLIFDPTKLEFISIENADFLPAGALAFSPIIEEGSVIFAALVPTGTDRRDGTLAIATFKVLADTETTIGLEDVEIGNQLAQLIAIASVTGATINSTTSTTDSTTETQVETPTVPSTDTSVVGDDTVSSTTAGQVEISAVSSVDNPAVGDTIEVAINIAGASNVAGYEIKLIFDPTKLEFISIENADFLPAGALAFSPIIEEGSVIFAALVPTGTDRRDGTLAIATFKVLADTETTVRFEKVEIGDSMVQPLEIASVTGATINRAAPTAGSDIEYLLSIPLGYSLIHVPLKVTAVDGVAKTIESIGDLYDAFGGANAVKLLLTLDSHTQEWFVYFGPPAKGTPADRELTDDMGILAQMNTPVSVRLTGSPLGTNGNSIITLNPGYNLVGVPLNDSRLTYVSDLFTLEGIGGNAPVVIFTDNGDFKGVVPGGGPGDIPIIGSQAFILEAQRAAMVIIYGDGWTDIK